MIKGRQRVREKRKEKDCVKQKRNGVLTCGKGRNRNKESEKAIKETMYLRDG